VEQVHGRANLEGVEGRGGRSGGNGLAGASVWGNDHCFELNFDIESQCTGMGRDRGGDAVGEAMCSTW
jgi:hypothetical protein